MVYDIPAAFHPLRSSRSPSICSELGYLSAPPAFSSSLIPSTTNNPTSTSSSAELILTINTLRKDLLSPHPQITCLALGVLGDIMDEGVAREVGGDVAGLVTHSKPWVSKASRLAARERGLSIHTPIKPTWDETTLRREVITRSWLWIRLVASCCFRRPLRSQYKDTRSSLRLTYLIL